MNRPKLTQTLILMAWLLPFLASAHEATESALRFSGFLDLRYRNVSSSLEGQGRGAESGFLLEDSAFSISKQTHKLSFLLDLPFSRAKEATQGANGANNPGFSKSSNSDLEFVKGKAQAVVSYQINENLKFNFGQFDTLFGFELNDSKDRFFGQTGLVYNYALPVTHMGAYAELTYEPWTVKLMAANANGRGSRDNTGNVGQSTTHGEDNTEYGATVSRSWGIVRTQIGYLVRPRQDMNGKRKKRQLLDYVIGTTLFEQLQLDAEIALVNDPAKDTDGDNDFDTGGEGRGYMLHATYNLQDNWLLGARYELINKRLDPLSKQMQAYALGAHYQLETDLRIQGEVIRYEVEPGGGRSDHSVTLVSVGGLLTF